MINTTYWNVILLNQVITSWHGRLPQPDYRNYIIPTTYFFFKAAKYILRIESSHRE